MDWDFGYPQWELDGGLRPGNVVSGTLIVFWCSNIKCTSHQPSLLCDPRQLCVMPRDWLCCILTCLQALHGGKQALPLLPCSRCLWCVGDSTWSFSPCVHRRSNTWAVPWWCCCADVLQGHFLSHPSSYHCPGSGRRKWNSLWRQRRGGAVYRFCCSVFIQPFSIVVCDRAWTKDNALDPVHSRPPTPCKITAILCNISMNLIPSIFVSEPLTWPQLHGSPASMMGHYNVDCW